MWTGHRSDAKWLRHRANVGGGGGQKFKSDCNIVAVGANKRVIYFEYVCKASGNDTNSGYSSMLKLLSLLGHQ